MGGVIQVPYSADQEDHGVARVAGLVHGRPRDGELRFSRGVLVASEAFAVDTSRETDVGPIPIEHPELAVLPKHVRRWRPPRVSSRVVSACIAIPLAVQFSSVSFDASHR